MNYPISTHCFMLPIRWDYLPQDFAKERDKSIYNFDIRTEIEVFNKKLGNTAWERKFYKIDNHPEIYNENTYFHAYATYTLFDLQQADEKDNTIVHKNKTMVYYEIDCIDSDSYTIIALNKTYTLKLTGISLHVYNTGVAILTFNLENWQYKFQEDILKINEFGRRIYPQFLGNQQPFTNSPKHVFLADKIEIKCDKLNYGLPFSDDFTQYDNLKDKETHCVNENGEYIYNTIVDIPNIVKQLFNANFVYNAAQEIQGDVIRFNILTDDRMFFQSWYGNNQLASSFSKEIKLHNNETYFAYAQSNFWYAFIFGDKTAYSLGIANKYMQEKNILECTYDRWAGYGTLFGLTRDSFVAVSSDVDTLIKNFVPDIRIHFKTMYYHMAVLCLAQRASILRFSAEVSSLADLGKSDVKEVTKRVQQLYLNYIEFINKIYFREITPQIQGIEIYQKFQNMMNIPSDIKNLDDEISELHEYVSLLQDEQRNNEADRLNKIATAFLPLTLIFGILGANFIDSKDIKLVENTYANILIWTLVPFIISYLIYFLIRKKQK